MANANPFIVGGGSNSNAWNYSRPGEEGYTDTIVGTVTKMTYRQTIDFNTKAPKFYDDGHPAMGYVLTITGDDGKTKWDWIFDAKKSSQAVIAIGRALKAAEDGPINIMDLAGKRIQVHTPGLQSIKTKTGRIVNARVWQVRIDPNPSSIPFEGTEVIEPGQQGAAAPAQAPAQNRSEEIQEITMQTLNAMAASNQPQGGGFAQQPAMSIYDEDIPF